MTRLRVLNEAYKEVLALDPQTGISKNLIRQLALSGKIDTVMAGRRRLISLDSLFMYLENPPQEQPKEGGGIRRIEK